jgi:hypothetical protein
MARSDRHRDSDPLRLRAPIAHHEGTHQGQQGEPQQYRTRAKEHGQSSKHEELFVSIDRGVEKGTTNRRSSSSARDRPVERITEGGKRDRDRGPSKLVEGQRNTRSEADDQRRGGDFVRRQTSRHRRLHEGNQRPMHYGFAARCDVLVANHPGKGSPRARVPPFERT